MGLIVENKGGDFEPAPQGTKVGRCYGVIDLGNQFNEHFQVTKRECMLLFELGNDHMKDGRPFIVQQRYTSSLSEKSNLRKALENWRGRKFSEAELQGFDLRNIVGKYALLSIVHNESRKGTTFANIGAIMQLPPGTQTPPPVNKDIVFDVDNWDADVFNSLTEYVQGLINSSEEVQGKRNKPAPQNAVTQNANSTVAPSNNNGDFDDDIPF